MKIYIALQDCRYVHANQLHIHSENLKYLQINNCSEVCIAMDVDERTKMDTQSGVN